MRHWNSFQREIVLPSGMTDWLIRHIFKHLSKTWTTIMLFLLLLLLLLLFLFRFISFCFVVCLFVFFLPADPALICHGGISLEISAVAGFCLIFVFLQFLLD